MSSVEPARHALYSRLEDVLGPEHAETLMTHLPTHRSGEVATKADIDRLEMRFDRLEDRIDSRFQAFDHRLDQMQRTLVVSIVGSMTALTAIFSLVVRFLG